MVINTNTQALSTANSLNVSNTQLSKALARLSSGSRIVVPSDDAAGLAVSSRLESQVKRLDATVSNVINAISFTQTQDGFLKTVDKAFRRMGELAMLALDTTKSAEDLGLYNQEFIQIKDYINATVGQTYNSVSLFSTDTIPVTVDSEGVTFAMSAINLDAPTYKSAVNSGTDAWKLTADAWQVTKDGYTSSSTTYKTSKDLWRTSAGVWAATDNGGIKYASGSYVTENITAVDSAAKTLATGSFAAKAVTLVGASVNPLGDQIQKTAHGLSNGDRVTFTGTAPTGADTTTAYYAKSIDANTLELYTDSALTTKVSLSKDAALTGASVVGATDIFTKTAHGFEDGDKVNFNSPAPAPATTTTTYFAKKVSANTFEIYTDSGLTTKLNVTADGSAISLDSNKVTGVSVATTDILTKVGHGLQTGDTVAMTAAGGSLGGTTFTSYHVKRISADEIELYTSSALTTKVDFTTAGTNLRLNVESFGVTAQVGTEIKKGSFVKVDPILTGENPLATKSASGSVVVINKSVQDISAFATELSADYDNVNLNSVAGAQIAIDLVKKATIQIATDRAKLGAMQSRLNFTHERLTVTKENLSVAISRIADVDVAEEATQYARYQILVQSGTSMLREANAMPQAALKLLQ